MSLPTLANELASMIFEYLSPRDLSAVSSSCRSLNMMVESTLYSTLDQNRTSRKVVPLLIRTILEKPHLGSHFKSIKFQSPPAEAGQEWWMGTLIRSIKESQLDSSYLPKPQEILTQLKRYIGSGEGSDAFAIWAHPPDDVIKHWHDSMSQLENFDSMVALLLLLVPNLKTLEYVRRDGQYVVGALSYTHSVLPTASKIQRDGVSNTRYALAQLQELFMYGWSKKPTGIRDVVPLFHMPSLVTFACTGCELDDDCRPSRTSSIRNLNLCNTSHNQSSQMPNILSLFNMLETLKIQIDYRKQNFELITVLDSIAHSQSTLKELQIIQLGSLIATQPWSVPSFVSFINLRILSLEWRLLDGNLAAKGCTFCFADLPPALEKLVIHNAAWRCQMWTYLQNNICHLSAVPRLASIAIYDGQRQNDGGMEWRASPREQEISVWSELVDKYGKHGCVFKLPSYFPLPVKGVLFIRTYGPA